MGLKVIMIEHFSSVNQYALELCAQLANHAQVLLLTVDSDNLSTERKYAYKKILYGHLDAPRLRQIAVYLKSLFATAMEICRERPDILHIQSFRGYHAELLLYKLLRRKVGAVVYTAHNISPHENAGDVSPYRGICRFADAIIVHNETCKKILMEDGIPSGKIYVIPHGVYGGMRSRLQNRAETSPRTEFLQFGIIRKYKGIGLLLKAISLLPETYKEKTHFTIAGYQDKNLDDTDYGTFIEQYGLSGCVTFLCRRVSNQEMAELFNAADACVFPYVNIYGSGSLLMSYTFEKPVIVSDIPALREETENGLTGLLFKNQNAKSLADQIMAFTDLSKAERENFRVNISSLIRDKYSWEKSAAKTAGLYRSLQMEGSQNG